jgi:hypothetical protein
MISVREHPEFEVMNDYIDGRLDAGRRAIVSQHLETCESCQREHADLTSLLQSTATLPQSVLPPDDIWTGIRSSIDHRKEVTLLVGEPATQAHLDGTPSTQVARPWWAYRSLLAAAAIVLVIVSSGLTAIMLRESNGSTQMGSVSAPVRNEGARLLPAGFRRAETEYLHTITQLRATLQAHRAVLRPETIAAVEHSLSVIDAAIEEARAALLSDPSNATLVDLLTASYERKVDLLRRAADLGVQT